MLFTATAPTIVTVSATATTTTASRPLPASAPVARATSIRGGEDVRHDDGGEADDRRGGKGGNVFWLVRLFEHSHA